ncbi:MAG: hypothetical protein U0798_16080 [Gemmataceae bacterium]
MPYDPYGWKSGLRLIEWSKKIDKKVLKTLGDKPYSLDKELDQWVEMVASGNVNPVIIYVGLHGGVDQNGNPVLYSGSNNSSFPLADVLDKLNEKAASKHIVLVLDTGRSLPDPNLGELSNDFSHAVKEKLGKRIAESKQLSVILSASDGQRAWDSPDLGMTSLAYHLAKSLVGTAGSKYWDSFSLLDLYETLERSVSTWSQNNRPTNQDIQLIPDKSEWLNDPKRSNTKNWSFFRMTDPEEIANPSRSQASEELIQTWKECDELGSQQRRVPANVYTPANWRRYRELLLRYERAVTSGDQAGEAVIKNALNEAKVIIERGLDLKLNSQGYSIPLFASLGNPNDKLQSAVSQLDQQPSLKAANDIIKTALSGNSQTPVEFHLPIMLSNFNNQILKVGNEENGPFVSNWKQAVRTRRLAEQAACSFSDGFPYSEYVWPVIRSEVLAGDLLRRQGEDRIHIVQKKNDEHDKAAKQFFDMAEKKYRSALETAKRLQSALRTCNDALADLPFLSRWITESDLELSNPGSLVEMNEKLIEALKLTNQLSSKLIAEKGTFLVNDDLDKATKSVEVAMTTLRNALEKSIIMPYESDTNENWLRIELLLILPSPIIKEENRKQLYNRWRQISAQKPQNQDAETNRKQTIIVTQEQKIARRLAAATESLDGPFGKWSKFSPLTLQFDSKEKYAIAAYLSVQKQLEANFEKQSSEGVSGSLSEMISRSAVPSLKLDQEPAMQASAFVGKHSWKGWLRESPDHWYNQNGNVYFAQTIAGEMLRTLKNRGRS